MIGGPAGQAHEPAPAGQPHGKTTGETDLTSVMVTTRKTLTLAGTRMVLDSARRYAESIGVAVCLAVVDQAGTLLAFERMDGAATLSIQIAQDKAYTVTAFGLNTRDWYPLVDNEPALLHGIVKTDRLVIFGGGVSVTVGGTPVGAIGVSGGTAEQDHEIACAGASIADEMSSAN